MELTEAAKLLRRATTDPVDPTVRNMMTELIRESYPEVWEGIVETITALDEAEEASLRESRLSKLQGMFSHISGGGDAYSGGEDGPLSRYAPEDLKLINAFTYEWTTGKVSEPGEAPEMTSTGSEWGDVYPQDKVDAPPRGLYIAIEGIDGSGKSTQAELLAMSMGAKLIREPGGTQVGDAIRSIIKDPEVEMFPLTEVYLFATARAQLLGEIGAILDSGIHVVSDRTVFSSLAYQVGRDGITGEMVAQINDEAMYEIPDLVILLDVEEGVALARIGGQSQDVMEDRVDMAIVRDRYLSMAHHATEGLGYLDGVLWDVVYGTNLDVESTHAYIVDIVNGVFASGE